jgi:hypothetical protein
MKRYSFIIIILAALIWSCKKDDLGQARLFRPVISGQLSADSNTIVASWQKITGAKGYEARISRDTFKTVDVAVVKDTNTLVAKGLKFNQLYQVQVRAIAPDSAYNSGWTYLGEIRTLSSILFLPSASDITLNSVRVRWATKGAPVTSIKITKKSDGSTAAQVNLTPADVLNEYKIVTGLQPSTPYIIYLYSGTDERGYVEFTTKAPFAGNVIDLTGFTGRPGVLADTIPFVASGSTIILKRNETYNIASNIALGKNLVIISQPDLAVPNQARIYMTSNFAIPAGTAIDSLEFNDVTIYSDNYTSRYMFNNTNNISIGKLKFMNSRMEIFRGLIRLQSGTTSVGSLIIDNCIIDSLQGYGLLTVDNVSCKVDNIRITNSTIYKAEKVIVSKQSSVSVVIESCTFNESPAGGGSSYYIDYNTAGTNEVTGGVSVTNCIFGPGKLSGTSTSVRDYRMNATSGISAVNNYRTNDHATSGNDFANISTYNRPSTQLFTSPQTGNFKILDVTFPGKSSSGDPRWRL